MSAIITLDKLYDNYNILSDAKDKIAEHGKEFLETIEGTKGAEKEKMLAAQIIPKFFKHFPALQCQAVDALFDICEDEDSSVRIAGMKGLPVICKDSKEFISKVADILAQLLQLDDPQEYNVASNSLLQILKYSPLTVIRCIFKQIHASVNTTIRTKCVKFVITKVKTMDESTLTPEVEDLLIAETKRVLQNCTSGEFLILMPFLISTRLSQSFTGQQELVDIVADKAEIDEDFEPLQSGSNNVDRLVTCIKFVLPYFSSKMDSNKFVAYICDQVLPQWDKIATLQQGELLQLAILRQLAELSTNCGKFENPSLYVVQVYDKLKDYMPGPPEDPNMDEMPSLDFTVVECLLYTFHRLARQCPDFLTHDALVLKSFRARLMYFSRASQSCVRALNNVVVTDKTQTEEEIKKRKIAPRVLNNINTLIRDLFYQPPKYQTNIILSFKTTQEPSLRKSHETETAAANKRHVPITFEANGGAAGSKQARSIRSSSSDSVKLYTPPSGKFSNNFYSYGIRGRGRNLRGGSGRGRGLNRNWRN